MTKQEQIRAVLSNLAHYFQGKYVGSDISSKQFNKRIDESLTTLSLLGLVIQVDDKLPPAFDTNDDVISAVKYKKKLEGYVKTIPIKESR